MTLDILRKEVITIVDQLCTIRCGKPPEQASDCKGYNRTVTDVPCYLCKGTGKIIPARSSTETPIDCWTCEGKGNLQRNYSCLTRLLSDNASFHSRKNWVNALKHDLERLKEIKQEMEKET
jgi:hypothetical protein